MNQNIKKIAELVVESLIPEAPSHALARAYLELVEKIDVSNQEETISSGRAYGNTTKFIYDLQVKIYTLKEEITKLKKSRDVLRKAIEWYEHESNWLYPEIRKDGSRMTKTIFVMREKAREAIKEDTEIMGGKL